MNSAIKLHIKVVAVTRPGEFIAVVGDVRELGSWRFEGAFPLDAGEGASCEGLWTGQATLRTSSPAACDGTATTELRYRYLIGRRLRSSSSGKLHTILVDWECSSQPRTLVLGSDRNVHVIEDIYGRSDGWSALSASGRGWLCDSGVCQVQLHFAQQPEICDSSVVDSLGSGKAWHVRCIPLLCAANGNDQRSGVDYKGKLFGQADEINSVGKFDGRTSQISPPAVWSTVAVLGEFTSREHTGIGGTGSAERLAPGSYMIFKVYTDDAASLAYRLEFYLAPTRGSCSLDDGSTLVVPECHAYLLPDQLAASSSSGTAVCSLQSGSRLVGSVRVKYLVAKPFQGNGVTWKSIMEAGLDNPLQWRHRQPTSNVATASLAATESMARHAKPDLLSSDTGGTASATAAAANECTTSSVEGRGSSLLIGHRGSGSTPAKGVQSAGDRDGVYENTLASFLRAFHYGVDMVELDVVLSKDKMPVIYHDFSMPVQLQHGPDLLTDAVLRHRVAIHELPANVLSSVCYILHKPSANSDVHGGRDWADGPRVCPPLEVVLQTLDPDCGLILEVKYPQTMASGSFEDPSCTGSILERNEFVDRILEVVMPHVIHNDGAADVGECGVQPKRRRRLAFACFDADVCALLRLKQALVPVLFLTMGRTKTWELYEDVRTRLVQTAIDYASCEGLHGVSVNSEDYLLDSSSVSYAHRSGLAFFSWGNECNNPPVFKALRDSGVDGIIYDRIHDLR